MDELAALYIRLFAKDDGASRAITDLSEAMGNANLSVKELQNTLSIFGGSAKAMYLAAASSADRFAAGLADLNDAAKAGQITVGQHAVLSQKLADSWINASRAASELQGKLSLLEQRGGGDAAGYMQQEMDFLKTRKFLAQEQFEKGEISPEEYARRLAQIQAEMNALLEKADAATRRYAEAHGMLANEEARVTAMVQQEITEIERLNQELDDLRRAQQMGIGDKNLVARGIERREKRIEELENPNEKRAQQSRREYYEWLNSEGTSAVIGHRSEIQKENDEWLVTSRRLEQLMPAEERHRNNLAMYQRQLQANLITQKQYNDLAKHSELVMRSHQMGGGKNVGQMAMQGSYALQDITTVAAMGGSPQMAMMSAANNLSQVAMVAGIANPALLALGAAVATVAVAFVDWGKVLQGTYNLLDSFTGRVRGIEDAAKGVKAAMEMREKIAREQFAAGEAGRTKTPKQITEDIEAKKRDVARIEDLIRTAQLEVQKARGVAQFEAKGQAAQSNMLRDMWKGAYGAVLGKAGESYSEGAFNLVGKRANPDELASKDARFLQAVENLRKFNEQLETANREVGLLSEVIPVAEIRTSLADRDKLMQKQESMRDQAEGRRAEMFLRAEKAASLVGDKRSPVQRSVEEAMSEYDRINKEAGYNEEERGGLLAEYAKTQQPLIQEEIEKLKEANKSRVSPQMLGYSQFGSQFQMNLLKPEDEAKAQRKEQIKNLEGVNERLDKLIEKPSGGAILQ